MDPTRLYVAPTGATNPLDQKYDIFDTVGNRRVNLFGFSFFDEVGGVLPGGTGLDLLSSQDTALPGTDRFSMTFNDYFATLKSYKVNYLRLFVFNPYNVRVVPFLIAPQHPGKYNLSLVSGTYLSRLDEFVGAAKSHGIVVCISLSSKQAIESPGFASNPFQFNNNTNGVIVDDAGNAVANATKFYCDIQEPNDPHPVQRKILLGSLQRGLFDAIVGATMKHWNVMYELFNEPHSGITHVREWHRIVAGWLHQKLVDPATGKRRRLVSISSVDDLLDERSSPGFTCFLDGLGIGPSPVGPPLVDVLSYHGGGTPNPSQWGGYGGGTGSLCDGTQPTPVDQIINGNNVAQKHQRGIIDAMHRLPFAPVALIFDTDSHYIAQRYPGVFAQEVLNVDGSFNQRWSPAYLYKIDEAQGPCTKVTVPPDNHHLLGLGERLQKMHVLNASRITVF
ncbi:MAG TPA: hypothetical protein VHI13_06175 [Candidatus Kapabacteria bacterium]|nr:hypothetical protein [Candidatus Kapabacteria bacterium]